MCLGVFKISISKIRMDARGAHAPNSKIKLLGSLSQSMLEGPCKTCIGIVDEHTFIKIVQIIVSINALGIVNEYTFIKIVQIIVSIDTPGLKPNSRNEQNYIGLIPR